MNLLSSSSQESCQYYEYLRGCGFEVCLQGALLIDTLAWYVSHAAHITRLPAVALAIRSVSKASEHGGELARLVDQTLPFVSFDSTAGML